MVRTLLLFFAVGATGWACWYRAMDVESTSETATWLLLLVPFVLAAVTGVVWWRRKRQPFRAAVAGLFLSGLASFLYWFWFLVAEPSLSDFEARTASSQWELTVVLFAAHSAAWSGSAGVGALAGSRLRSCGSQNPPL